MLGLAIHHIEVTSMIVDDETCRLPVLGLVFSLADCMVACDEIAEPFWHPRCFRCLAIYSPAWLARGLGPHTPFAKRIVRKVMK